MLRHAVGVLLIGCWGCGDMMSHECTDEARSSVQVTVTDDQGQPLTDAKVTFSVNGQAAEDCKLLGNDYVCGWEIKGAFVITARKAGYVDAQQSVSVGELPDGCHVDGKQLTLQLVPVT